MTAAPQPQLAFTYEWSVREHAQAQHDMLAARGATSLASIALGVIVLANAVLYVYDLRSDQEWLTASLPFTALALVLLWAFLYGQGWLNAWRQQRTDSSLQHPIQHFYTDNGLRVRGKTAEITLGWRSMKLVAETKAFVLFFFTTGNAYYLPKRVIAPEQLEALRQMIRANTAPNVYKP